MKFNKLNKNWNAASDSPNPEVSNIEEGISLSFFLNAIDYDHIDEEEKGSINFFGLHKYSIVSVDEEEYSSGQFRFKKEQLPWGMFYELPNSKWQNNFPDDAIIIDNSVNKKGLRHFIFFFKDEIFECLASEYAFTYSTSISEKLEEKYPKGYLSHYLAMFSNTFGIPSNENFKSYLELYIQMESEKELGGVKEELKQIKKNDELNLFLKLINQYELENFGKEELVKMIKVVENYKIKK